MPREKGRTGHSASNVAFFCPLHYCPWPATPKIQNKTTNCQNVPAPFKPRVLLASHFDRDVTAEPVERLRTMAAVDLAVQLIADCFAGKRPENLLNPDTWEQARIHNIRGD